MCFPLMSSIVFARFTLGGREQLQANARVIIHPVFQ